MKVGIIGTGYVGLVTGVGLAAKGHNVTCFDNKDWIVDGLKSGNSHIYERGLNESLGHVTREGLFEAELISEARLLNNEIVIITVGTPTANGKIDLTYVKSAAEIVGHALRHTDNFISIVVKSTVVPGTTDTLVRQIIEQISGKKLGQFGLGMNPEFLREGNAVEDFNKPDRIVFGHEDPETLKMLEALYSSWDCDKITVNSRTAEMIKYASNCLLAIQISAVNELANIVSAIGGIDIVDVMRGVHTDRRWSPILPDGNRIYPEILSYHIPGCGFGGSCFPKDLKGLKVFSEQIGQETLILDSVLKINENQPLEVIKLLKGAVGDLKGKKILILGLAFKPNTDDVRESISLKIINYLNKYEAEIIAHDPAGMKNAKRKLNNINKIQFTENWKNCLPAVNVAVVLTKWDEYRQLKESDNLSKLKGKIVLDARRLFKPDDFPETLYLSIGRSNGNKA